MVSRALVNKNNARVCLVDPCRNKLDTDPAKNPAIIEATLESPTILRAIQITALNIPEKQPINIPNLTLSPDFNICRILAGFLNIDFKESTRDIADLILYPNKKDLINEIRVDYTHPSSCLQCIVLSVLMPRSAKRFVSNFCIEITDLCCERGICSCSYGI